MTATAAPVTLGALIAANLAGLSTLQGQIDAARVASILRATPGPRGCGRKECLLCNAPDPEPLVDAAELARVQEETPTVAEDDDTSDERDVPGELLNTLEPYYGTSTSLAAPFAPHPGFRLPVRLVKEIVTERFFVRLDDPDLTPEGEPYDDDYGFDGQAVSPDEAQ